MHDIVFFWWEYQSNFQFFSGGQASGTVGLCIEVFAVSVMFLGVSISSS